MSEAHERTGTMTAGVAEAPARVLVVGSDAGTAGVLCAVLRHDGHTVVAHAMVGRATAQAADPLPAGPFDLVLIELDAADDVADDVAADAADGGGAARARAEASRAEASRAEALDLARACLPEVSVVLVAGYAALDAALGALRSGVYDYVMKPVDVDELRSVVAHALERLRLRRQLSEHARELAAAQAEADDFQARLQQEVDEATDDLRRRVSELKEANSALKQAHEQNDRFVAMVAHEMRGPLNPIINYAQLAKRPNLTPETTARYMDLIVEHAFRLNRLVDDLQTATRLSTGQFALRLSQHDLGAAVGEVMDQFTASVRGRRFSLECPSTPVLVHVDRDRIVQALRNLVDNAVKYSAEDGAIEVRVWQDEQYAYISVADYGAGITEAEMERIFSAFTRGDRTREIAGSGLGLYITRGIAAAHGGALSVHNRSGTQRAQGAIFTMSLPLAHAAAGADDD